MPVLRCPHRGRRNIVDHFQLLHGIGSSDQAGLGATLLYGIESDLAGAAGTPGELDNIALSGLTLIADPRRLYQMRYVDLPQSYYTAYSDGLANAWWYETALMSHIESIDSLEKPAVLADFLLRFDKVQWALVTAIYQDKLMLSIRTSSTKFSAADIMRRLDKKPGRRRRPPHQSRGVYQACRQQPGRNRAHPHTSCGNAICAFRNPTFQRA